MHSTTAAADMRFFFRLSSGAAWCAVKQGLPGFGDKRVSAANDAGNLRQLLFQMAMGLCAARTLLGCRLCHFMLNFKGLFTT